jgi:hypothetical protein
LGQLETVRNVSTAGPCNRHELADVKFAVGVLFVSKILSHALGLVWVNRLDMIVVEHENVFIALVTQTGQQFLGLGLCLLACHLSGRRALLQRYQNGQTGFHDVTDVGLLLLIEIATALADHEPAECRECAECQQGEDQNPGEHPVERSQHCGKSLQKSVRLSPSSYLPEP